VTLTYTELGQLASITDGIGMTSSFVYGTGDVITWMTTPYGTTTFQHDPNNHNFRFIEATDPLGAKERVEFHFVVDGMATAVPASEVPTGFTLHNENLDHYNSFYWNKRAMALHPGDRARAKLTYWTQGGLSGTSTTSIPHSVKRPLEGRVWYAYQGQSPTLPRDAGDWKKPIRVGRVLDDGTSRISQRTYNSMGRKTSRTDPLGRSRTFSYAANGIDVLEVRQTTGGINDLIASYSTTTRIIRRKRSSTKRDKRRRGPITPTAKSDRDPARRQCDHVQNASCRAGG
jgi:YD repeat-containing protein